MGRLKQAKMLDETGAIFCGSIGATLRMARSATANAVMMRKVRSEVIGWTGSRTYSRGAWTRQGPFPNIAVVVNTLPPANKCSQIVSIGAQSGGCQAANIFSASMNIDPALTPRRWPARRYRTDCLFVNGESAGRSHRLHG